MAPARGSGCPSQREEKHVEVIAMKNTSPEVDAYIARSAEFARPILTRVRRMFHQGCPAARETMKWSVPHFEYKGLLGSMAVFKEHVSFGFWKAKLMSDPAGIMKGVGNTAMGAVKVTSLDDLPADKVLLSYIKEAARLNDEDIKPARSKAPAGKKELSAPAYFKAALTRNQAALTTFENFSPSHKREYVEWVTEARQDATRERRLVQAIEWMAEGKPRNWKYMKREAGPIR